MKTYTYLDLLKMVDISKSEPCYRIDRFCRELDLYEIWDDEFSNRMKEVPVSTWLCGDTYVGIYAYYFDEKFVGFSFQSARKSDWNFAWASKESYDSVREYVVGLQDKPEYELINFDEDAVDESWFRS